MVSLAKKKASFGFKDNLKLKPTVWESVIDLLRTDYLATWRELKHSNFFWKNNKEEKY